MGCYDKESMLTTSLQSLFQGSCSNLFQTTGVEGCEGLLAKNRRLQDPWQVKGNPLQDGKSLISEAKMRLISSTI